eukprot:46791-Pelagomonas_calceolata.AAC.1
MGERSSNGSQLNSSYGIGNTSTIRGRGASCWSYQPLAGQHYAGHIKGQAVREGRGLGLISVSLIDQLFKFKINLIHNEEMMHPEERLNIPFQRKGLVLWHTKPSGFGCSSLLTDRYGTFFTVSS